MALVTVPEFAFPPVPYWLAAGNPTYGASGTSTIDAAGEKYAVIFHVPKTGSINRIRFATNAVTSSQNLTATLQTVSATDGNPTGSAYGGSSSETVTSPAATTVYTVTFATPASATKGDMVAFVLEWASTAGNMNFHRVATQINNSSYFYSRLYTTSWGAGPSPILSVVYDDNTSETIGGPPTQTGNPTFSITTATTPDEIGLRFKMPFGARAIGALAAVTLTTGRDVTLKLYNDAGTLLESTTPDNDMSSNGSTLSHVRFSSTVTLTKDSWYRLTYLPTSTSSVTLTDFTLNNTDELGMFNGSNVYQCYRTDAGSFTDDTAAYTAIALLCNAIDIPGIYTVNE